MARFFCWAENRSHKREEIQRSLSRPLTCSPLPGGEEDAREPGEEDQRPWAIYETTSSNDPELFLHCLCFRSTGRRTQSLPSRNNPGHGSRRSQHRLRSDGRALTSLDYQRQVRDFPLSARTSSSLNPEPFKVERVSTGSRSVRLYSLGRGSCARGSVSSRLLFRALLPFSAYAALADAHSRLHLLPDGKRTNINGVSHNFIHNPFFRSPGIEPAFRSHRIDRLLFSQTYSRRGPYSASQGAAATAQDENG